MLRCFLNRGSQVIGRRLQNRTQPNVSNPLPSLTQSFHRLNLYEEDEYQPQQQKRPPRQQFGSSGSSGANNEPLGRKRTWNVSQGAVRKLRHDVLQEKGYSVVNKETRNTNSKFGSHHINRLFSAERDLDEIKTSLSRLDTGELKEVMGFLGWSKNTQNRLGNFKLIQAECCERLKSLHISDRLLIADLFFLASYPASRYFEQLFSTVDMEWGKSGTKTVLDDKKLVQLLFYIGVYRNGPVQLFDNIEKYLSANIHNFSGKEVGLICNSFFASNRSLRNVDLLEGIAEVVLKDLNVMPLYIVTNVLKAFRHAHFTKVDFYEKLGNEVSYAYQGLSTSNATALANMLSCYASVKIRHDTLFSTCSKIIQEFLAEGTNMNIRTKDLARMLWAYSYLQLPLPIGLVESLIEGLQDLPDLRQMYPEMYTEAMLALTMNGVYIHDLLSEMLSPHSLKARKSRLLEQEHQFLLIDEAIGLEQPKYRGYRVPNNYQVTENDGNKDKVGLDLNIRSGLAGTWWTLQELLADPKKIRCHHVCKFSNIADLEMWLDEENKAMVIPDRHGQSNTMKHLGLCESIALVKSGEPMGNAGKPSISEQLIMDKAALEKDNYTRQEPALMHIPAASESVSSRVQLSDPYRKLIVKVTSWNQYALNSPSLTGIIQMELRLLSKMGYEILVINPKQAAAVETMTNEQRQAFIQEHVIKQLNISL